MSVQQLLKALRVITPAGKQPRRFEGDPLTKANINVFVKKYDGYCDQMSCGVSDAMLRNPVGSLELLRWSPEASYQGYSQQRNRVDESAVVDRVDERWQAWLRGRPGMKGSSVMK